MRGARVGSVICGVVWGLVLAVAPWTSLAQSSQSAGPSPLPEQLTQALVSLNARYSQAGPAEQARLLGDLLTVAADRQRLLIALIETGPGAVLKVALPASLRAGLPPPVQAFVEEEVEIEGVLEVLHEDRDSGSRYLYFLQTATERLSLHFAADSPALQTGTRVRVKGLRIGRALVLAMAQP